MAKLKVLIEVGGSRAEGFQSFEAAADSEDAALKSTSHSFLCRCSLRPGGELRVRRLHLKPFPSSRVPTRTPI